MALATQQSRSGADEGSEWLHGLPLGRQEQGPARARPGRSDAAVEGAEVGWL